MNYNNLSYEIIEETANEYFSQLNANIDIGHPLGDKLTKKLNELLD